MTPQKTLTLDKIPPKRFDALRIVYKGKSFTIPALFQEEWREKNEDRTLLNDTLIEFYMCHHMWDNRYDDNTRSRLHVFNTFFFDKLQTHFRRHFHGIVPRKSEVCHDHSATLYQKELGAHYNRMFQKTKPGILLGKDILVIPCHLKKPKHWFLILVHNPSGAILRRKVPVQSDENNNSNEANKSMSQLQAEFAEYEERKDCRIVIMDSMCHSRKFRQLLDNAHNHAFECIKMWLQMAAAANGDETVGSRIRKVVCQTLPKQTNGVDCGIFMMAYAEYFTWFNVEWMNQPTETLEYLRMDDWATNELTSEVPRLRLETELHKYMVPTP